MRTSTLRTGALCLLAVVAALVAVAALRPSIAHAGISFYEKRFPMETPDRPDMNVRIDGTRVVWEGASTTPAGKDIWYWDFSKPSAPVNISALAGRPDGDQRSPDISGDRIVYVEDVPADFQLRLRGFNLKTMTDFSLNQGIYYEDQPDIDGNHIVFQGNLGGQGDIYLLTFPSSTATSGVLTQLTNSTPDYEGNPAIDGDRIVWSNRKDTDDAAIEVYSISAGEIIYDTEDYSLTGVNTYPDIDGNWVVFLHSATAGGDQSPWTLDLARPIDPWSLTAENRHVSSVRVSGDMVYWMVGSGTSGMVRTYNYATDALLAPIPNSIAPLALPRASVDVDGCYAVWDDGRDDRRDIFLRTAVLKPKRVSGSSRADTAVSIARESYGTTPGHWAPTLDYVVIASGDDAAAADPISAAGLCWAYEAPLLLTSKTGLPATTLTALKQMHADNPALKIIVVGGPVPVPNSQLTAMKAVVGSADVERLLSTGGRYEMAAAISARMRLVRGAEMRDGVLFANGADPTKFSDALALSAISRHNGMPILLVGKDVVPAATTAEIANLVTQATSHGTTLIRILGGGTGTVSEAVRVKLDVNPSARWYGSDRYKTAAAVAEKAIANYFATAGYTAVAAKIPDALAGGVMAGQKGGVLLLTATDSLPASTGNVLHEHRNGMAECYLLGGTVSITPATAAKVTAELAP